MKPIILCADDYGMEPSIGAAIRGLAAARRISAVSCLSGTPFWPAEAARLQRFRGELDVGLHFGLTPDIDPDGSPLAAWIRGSLLGRVDRERVERNLRRQLDLFEAAWGSPPDFLDGHQHVHVFPEIRAAVLRVLVERYTEGTRPWLRQVNPSLLGHDAPAKALALRVLAAGFRRECRRARLAFTGDFIGLYSLSEEADFPGMVAGWLRRARPGSLMMCHPGMDGPRREDLGPVRLREYRYLLSGDFEALLRSEGIELARGRQIRSLLPCSIS